jgi:UDP-N-acetylglucosamine--N-acetylmuramyl-(pentapeptide) pyrophosphoryl-undecaprenol N-acetylglucosamine transferase
MEKKNVDIVFTCGGTGGHVYPIIALAQAVEAAYSFAFFGSENRQDSLILPRYGYSFDKLPSSSRNMWTILRSFFIARRLLLRYNPKVLVSSGGYHTFPIVLAAKWVGIPIVLLEQNVLPGKVTRFMARFADHVCISFAQSKHYFKHGRLVLTGNPVRKRFLDDSLSQSFKQHIPFSKYVLLVIGGSQGAQALNICIESLYDRCSESDDWTIIHLTGKAYFQKEYGDLPYKSIANHFGRDCIFVVPYFENMALLYRVATFIVARAGATTLAELLAVQKQCVLVPYPYAADNHQVLNAKIVERVGLGKMLLESDMTADKIWALAEASCQSVRDEKPVVNATEKVVAILERYL